jgi:hypothetical protein
MLGVRFNPAPAAALPAETFAQTHQLRLNNEYIELGYFQPAHTDTDIYVQFVLSEVLHLGDTFFNGFYPIIDLESGGNIKGMIAATGQARMAGQANRTRPRALADREALLKYRDMLVTVRDRVRS